MKRFGFNVAAGLYAKARHPRMLYGATDLEKLRRQTRKGAGKKILDALRPGAEACADGILGCRDVIAHLRSADKRVTAVRSQPRTMAFVGELDKNERLMVAARRALLACARDGRVDPEGYDLVAPYLTEKERRFVTRGMVSDIRTRIEGRRMSYYANTAHNLTFGYALGGLWGLLAIKGDPGVPDMSREERELVRRYEATLHSIVHPDGYPEEDIGYGTGVFGAQLLLGEALRRAGLLDPYEVCPGVRNFGQAMLHFVQPWGEAVSNTGDHGSTFAGREFSLPRVATETNDPTVLWLSSVLEDAYRCFAPADNSDQSPSTVRIHGGFITQVSTGALLALDDIRKPVHPAKASIPTQYQSPGRGIATFRSSWKKDAAFVVFDGAHRSPACPGHWHDSCGHFSLSALGEMFAIDTGRYNNEQDQHNVVIVNGKSGRSTRGEWVGSRYHGQLIDYQPDDLCDVAAADNSHQADCYWSRRWLGLVKGGSANYVWTVEDVNKNDDWNEFWWQMQTSPTNTITTRKGGATVKGWRHGNCLDVKTLVPSASEFDRPHTVSYEQDVNSTSSYKYVKDPFARAAEYVRPERMAHGPCFVRPRLLVKVSGLNGRFMSIMTPRLKGAPRAKVRQLRAVPSTFAAQVEIGPYRDTILFAYEHQLLEADDIVARGKWAVVRRRAGSGRIVAWTLGHGSSLRVGGRKLC